MLTKIRNSTRGAVAVVIIGLIALGFTVMSISDSLNPVSSDTVIAGAGDKVTTAEYLQLLDRQIRQMETASQGQVTREAALNRGIHHDLLGQMVFEETFDQLIAGVGAAVSDENVAREVRGMEQFRSQATGEFDRETYYSTLARERIPVALFEKDVREQMTRNMAAHALAAGLRVPSAYGKLIYAFDNEKRTISAASFSTAKLPPIPQPTDAQIEAYYQERKNEFRLPEYRTVVLVEADPAAYAETVAIDEAKIKAQYEFERPRLTTPERRTYLVLGGAPDEKTAAQAAERLRAGDAPGAIAQSMNLRVETLADQTRADALDRKLADAAFQVGVGEVTKPTALGLTWSVARVQSITPAVTPSLDDSRERIRAELAEEAGEEAADAATRRFDDLIGEGATLEQAAQQAGLSVVKVGEVDARGLSPAGEPVSALADDAQLVKVVFSAVEGEPTDWDTGANGVFRRVLVEKVRPAGPPPLAQIRDQVVSSWRALQTREALDAVGDRLEADLKAGKSFAEAARAHGFQVRLAEQSIVRTQVERLPPEASAIARIAFGAKPNEVSRHYLENGATLLAIFLDEVELPKEMQPGAVDERRRMASQPLTNDVLNSVVEAKKAVAKLQVAPPERLDALVGKTTGEAS